MLGVSEVNVRDDIDDSSVGFLGQAFVLAAVSRFHMEDGNVQTLRTDNRQAGVCISKNKDSIGLRLNHQLVAGGDNISHSLAEIFPDGVQINLGLVKIEIAEEYSVEIIIVVLTCVRKNGIKVFAAFFDDFRKSYNFRTRSDNYKQL